VVVFNFIYAGLRPHTRVAIIFYFTFGRVKDTRRTLWQVEATNNERGTASQF
jgi:hypothetical protein